MLEGRIQSLEEGQLKLRVDKLEKELEEIKQAFMDIDVIMMEMAAHVGGSWP